MRIKGKMGDTFVTQIEMNESGDDKKDLSIEQILEILKR